MASNIPMMETNGRIDEDEDEQTIYVNIDNSSTSEMRSREPEIHEEQPVDQEDNQPLWDVFRKQEIFEESSMCSGVSKNILPVAKIFTIAFLFIAVYGGTIAAKASLQVLTTFLHDEHLYFLSTGQTTPAKDVIRWLLIFIIFIPDILTSVSCGFNILFGNKEYPLCKIFLWNILIEVFHLFGVCALVFKVMPFLGPVHASLAIATIPMLPGLVHACRMRKTCRVTSISVVLLAAAMVVNVLILFFNFNGDNKIEVVLWTPISLCLVSLRSIKTYISKGANGKDRSIQGADITTMTSSTLRVLLGALVVPFYFCKEISGINESFSNLSKFAESAPKPLKVDLCLTNMSLTNCTDRFVYVFKLETDILPFFFVHFFGAFVVYRCAVMACQMCMQRASFAIPLWTATPTYVVVTYALMLGRWDWLMINFVGGRPDLGYWVHIALAVFFVAWMAQLLICRRAFKKLSERLMQKHKYDWVHGGSPLFTY